MRTRRRPLRRALAALLLAALVATAGCGKSPTAPRIQTATIDFVVAESGSVEIDIRDTHGRTVRTFRGASYTAGTPNSIQWDLLDENGHRVQAGTYVVEFFVNGRHVEPDVVMVVP